VYFLDGKLFRVKVDFRERLPNATGAEDLLKNLG
jgi:hypothetical protein